VIDYIQKGGLLMWPILVCSIVAIAVFAERLFYLHRATIHVGEFLKGLSNLIQRRNFAEALHESAGTPVRSRASFTRPSSARHAAVGTREIVQKPGNWKYRSSSASSVVLATIAFLAPLLGLARHGRGMIDASERLLRMAVTPP